MGIGPGRKSGHLRPGRIYGWLRSTGFPQWTPSRHQCLKSGINILPTGSPRANPWRFSKLNGGDPRPAPNQLTLNRSLWLRFDGSGYTIQDTIKGQKNTNWRLEIDPGITLGRVAVDGSEQLITQRVGSDRAGIELRNGMVNLVADSLYQGAISALPATGWDHDFQQVQGRLFLPPGWKLLNAAGIDNIPRT